MITRQQIKVARFRAGLTQQQLASRAGVSENTISRVETGRIRPSNDLLEALRRCLCLPKVDLFASEHWEDQSISGGEQ